jgi:AcrR family transcriptional regulator
MAIKDRKERDKLDRRKLIIESATKLFLKNGYDKTSIRNIADDIEYSPATIYLYFKEKDEIFYIIHEQGFQILNKLFLPFASIEDPLERLHKAGHLYIQFALENPDYYDLMFIMRAPLNEIACHETWNAGDNAFQFLLTTVRECLDKKLLIEQDSHLVALSVWSFVHGLVSLHIRERLKAITAASDETIQTMLYNSLKYFLIAIKA